MKAQIWYRQRRLEDAASEALGALEIHEKFGALKEVSRCMVLFRDIERSIAGGLPKMMLLPSLLALPSQLATSHPAPRTIPLQAANHIPKRFPHP